MVLLDRMAGLTRTRLIEAYSHFECDEHELSFAQTYSLYSLIFVFEIIIGGSLTDFVWILELAEIVFWIKRDGTTIKLIKHILCRVLTETSSLTQASFFVCACVRYSL